MEEQCVYTRLTEYLKSSVSELEERYNSQTPFADEESVLDAFDALYAHLDGFMDAFVEVCDVVGIQITKETYND